MIAPMSERDGRPVRVLMACSGLEHAQRGYESFARECFDTLKDEPVLDIELIKGSGPSGDRERAVPSLKRAQAAARALARVKSRPLAIEQFAFAFSLQPAILRRGPE